MNASTKKLVSRLALALGFLALAAPAAAETGSYGYLRVVEGSATLMQAGTTERSSAEINQPVLAGDRLWVPGRSRVEVVLADRNLLRIDGGSEVILERLAASPDRSDRATVLRLLEGNLQLVVTQDSLGDELPRIETPNATVYPQNYGVYRVTADRDGWSQVVVRRGSAEVVTDRGSARVRADEEAIIEGDRDASVDVGSAGNFDTLERWARRLDDDYAAADVRYVDDNLRYSAAPLNRYGDWIHVDGSPYWRPRVDYGWRPYWQGRWIYTPAGLTWISYEPWGWVPYHYGSWDYLPGYGWAWQPGYVWSPAWVYWYWGPSYVGWCPTGYYTRFYGPRFGFNFGFRSGLYGWAGGHWGHFGHWSFVRSSYFDYRHGYRDGYRDGYWDGRRDVQRYAVPIDPTRSGQGILERGIITTDTKPLKPATWGKNPEEVLRALRPGRSANELPDVTSFIARKPDLSDTLVRTVRAEGNTGALDGTPLKPGSLGREGRGRRVEIEGSKPNFDPSGKPRVTFGDDGPQPGASGQPRVTEKPQVDKPSSRSGRPAAEADGGSPRPRVVIEKPERPTASEPSTQSDPPGARWQVRERPSRPAPEADGGAPRPTGRVETEDKPSGKPNRPSSAGEAPAVRERPSRPAPEADGGAPRPDRGQGEEKPRVETRPPASRDRSDFNVRRYERPPQDAYVRPETPPARPDRVERFERPERYERPERDQRPQHYERPEPRVSPPVYRAPERSPEPSRRPDPPRYDRDGGSSVRPSGPPQRSRGHEGSRPQARERHARPRDNGGNENR